MGDFCGRPWAAECVGWRPCHRHAGWADGLVAAPLLCPHRGVPSRREASEMLAYWDRLKRQSRRGVGLTCVHVQELVSCLGSGQHGHGADELLAGGQGV